MSNSLVLGVDIGGSHITAAVIDLENIAILPQTKVRKNINSRLKTAAIISLWAEALLEATSELTLSDIRIGIAMPGPLDYEKGICFIKDQDKYDSLYGLNIKELLAAELHVNPENIKFINDAGAFLQGEIFAGAGKDYQDVIGVTLGTGLGTSRYHLGQAADANLWCAPFLNSIAEDYLSTRWFVNRYQELTGKLLPDAKALADLAQTDPEAAKVFEEFGNNLGLFLNYFIQLDKPEVIILGGNIANADTLFLPATQKVLTSPKKKIRLDKAKLGEEASLIGAASCWHLEVSNQLVTAK